MLVRLDAALGAGLLLASAARAQTTTVTIPASQDATIYWCNPGAEAANGAGEWLHTNFDYTAEDPTHDFLVQFDIAAHVPAGATIRSARLEIVCLEIVYVCCFPLGAAPVNQPWTEGPSNPPGTEWGGAPPLPLDVTCVSRSWPGNAWTYPIVTGPGMFSAPQAPPGLWTAPSTAASVARTQSWLDSPATNFGLFFNCFDGGRFASRENTTFPGPRMIVEYDPPCPAPVNYCVAAPNSRGPGAIMGWSGSTSVAQNNFALTCSGGIPNGFGFFFFGDGQQQTPFGNGFVCVAGNVFRFLPGDNFNLAGVATRPVDMNSGVGTHLVPGSTWNFQIKYRDVAGGGALFNYSDGLSATFCP